MNALRVILGQAMGLTALAVTPAMASPMDDDALRRLPLGSFVDATSLEQLAEMVVTESKVAQSSDSVTQKIIVLRGDDLDRQPNVNRNLAESMRYTSGQFVNVLSRNDANWGSYAGLGPKYNSYLLDGLPIDSFVDPMSLDSAAIERIEVHKGPASVLYSNYLTMDFAGNETPLAGITNLILKDRVETDFTRLSLGAGSYGTTAGRAYTQGRNGGLSYIFGASAERSDYHQYGTPNSWLQTVTPPDYEKTKVFGNLSYALGRQDHSLSLFFHRTDHNGDMGRPNREFKHEYDTVNIAYSNQIDESLHIQLKAGERRYAREFANDDYPASLALTRTDNTRQIIHPVDMTISYRHNQNATLTTGVDGQWVNYETTNRNLIGDTTTENKVRAQSIGYFAQEKFQWQDWVFRGGVRHNTIRHDYTLLGGNTPVVANASWGKTLWSLGTRYNISPYMAFYANAGSSFMVPAAKQIGGTVSSPTASGELPNPALKPENGLGRDLGLDWQPTRSLGLGIRAFLNTIDSAIVTNVVSAAPSQTRSENAGSARASGIEFDLRYTPSTDVSWFANLTQTRTRVTTPSNADQDGNAIPFAPDIIANIGMSVRLPWKTTVSSYYHWVGRYFDSTSRASRMQVGNYGVLNIRVQSQLRPGIELLVDLNNVGNRHFNMPFEFRDPGFNAFAGLNFTF